MGLNIAVIEDILDESSAQAFAHEGPLVEFLQKKWPHGFEGRACQVTVNSVPLCVDDYDWPVCPDDVVIIAFAPRDPITAAIAIGAAGTIGQQLTVYLIATVLISLSSALITRLFAQKPKGPQGQARRVYEIGARQNQPALGDVVPEHFGTTWFFPTYAAQPYSRFETDQQFLSFILLAGAGDVDIDQIRIGTTPIDGFPAGVVEYWVFKPADHGSQFGVIEAATGVYEDVVSSAEVQDIDLGKSSAEVFFGRAYAGDNLYKGNEGSPDIVAGDTVIVLGQDPLQQNHGVTSTVTIGYPANQYRLASAIVNDSGNPWYQLVKNDDGWRGWFMVCQPLKTTNRIELDFIFPNGLVLVDSSGNFLRWDAHVWVEVQEVDEQDLPVGGATLYKYVYTGRNRNPKRITEVITVPAARYRVRVKREDRDDATQSESSKVLWTGLRAFAVNVAGSFAYGDVTLVAMRMRATRALAESSTGRITFLGTRRLPTVASNFTAIERTKNPADAFSYIVLSGGGDQAGLDVVNLASLAPRWECTNGFNYRFEDQSTVFDCLVTTASNVRGTPSAYARQVGIRLDRAQEIDKFLVTSQQMLMETYRVGFKLRDDTDIDGYRVEYIDPNGTQELSVLHPLSAATPEVITLFGCTDRETALAQAKYLWQKRLTLRRLVEFDTELDGHCFEVGDRIAVLHPLVEWVSSGRVMIANGLTLTLDVVLPQNGAKVAILRSEIGAPSAPLDCIVTGNVVELLQDPGFGIFTSFSGQEGTTVVIGDPDPFRRSYIVNEINPSDGRVSVKALGYDGAEHAFRIPGEDDCEPVDYCWTPIHRSGISFEFNADGSSAFMVDSTVFTPAGETTSSTQPGPGDADYQWYLNISALDLLVRVTTLTWATPIAPANDGYLWFSGEQTAVDSLFQRITNADSPGNGTFSPDQADSTLKNSYFGAALLGCFSGTSGIHDVTYGEWVIEVWVPCVPDPMIVKTNHDKPDQIDLRDWSD